MNCRTSRSTSPRSPTSSPVRTWLLERSSHEVLLSRQSRSGQPSVCFTRRVPISVGGGGEGGKVHTRCTGGPGQQRRPAGEGSRRGVQKGGGQKPQSLTSDPSSPV